MIFDGIKADANDGIGAKPGGFFAQDFQRFFTRAFGVGEILHRRKPDERSDRPERRADHVVRPRCGCAHPPERAGYAKAVGDIEGYEILSCNHQVVPASSSPSVLIVRLDAIGDALVTVPLVAALKAAGYRVSAVLTARNAHAFAASALERVHVGHDCVQEVRACAYDVALIPSEETEAYEIARDARIPERVGFHHGWRGGKPFKSWWMRRQCTRGVFRNASLDTGRLHECEVVFQLGKWLLPGVAAPKDPAVLRPIVIDDEPKRDSRIAFQVTDKWMRLGGTFDRLCAAALKVSSSYDVRCIGASAEAQTTQAFREATGLHVETFDDLGPWKSAIAASRALVAPDSGAVHVAGMTGTPVVAAYEIENFAAQTWRWHPWAAPYEMYTIHGEWDWRTLGALSTLLSETAAV